MALPGGGSVRLFGAALILLAGGLEFLCYLQTNRQEKALLRDVISALELLASGVRWRRIPLPVGIDELGSREISGYLFAGVRKNMTGGMTLQEAWRLAFHELPGEAGDVLRHVDLGGDALRVEGELLHCAQALRGLYRERCSAQAERTRLRAALTLCAVGAVIIVLT